MIYMPKGEWQLLLFSTKERQRCTVATVSTDCSATTFQVGPPHVFRYAPLLSIAVAVGEELEVVIDKQRISVVFTLPAIWVLVHAP